MTLYIIMAVITMITTICVYIYQEDPFGVMDYAMGIISGIFVGLIWPLALACLVVVWTCLGILHMLRYLNIIGRW